MTSFFEAVQAEAARSVRAHDILRSYESWFMLLAEEVGEVAKAMNDDVPASELKAELVQVGMLAMVIHDLLEG